MIVYTGGTFDCFHSGHVNFLRECSKFGEVVVALNRDEFIEEFKGRRPIMSYGERAIVLMGCRFVSRVVPNTYGADSKPTIAVIQPDIIAIGTDWHSKDYLKQLSIDEEFLQDYKINLLYIPYTRDISTTDIRGRLNEAGDMYIPPATSIDGVAGRTFDDFRGGSLSNPDN